MADQEFEAGGIYGGNWWNMMNTGSSSSSLCSVAANNDGGNFSCSWQTHNLVDLRSLPLVFEHHHDSLGYLVQQKQNQNESSSPPPSASGNNIGNMFMDSTSGFALPPSSNLLGRPESDFQSVVLEEEGGGGVDSSSSEMKTSMNHEEFGIDHQQNLSSYGLYDDEEHNNNPLHSFQPDHEGSLFTNPSVAFTYNSANQVSPTWSKPSDDHFLKPQLGCGFHFSNNNNNNKNAPAWNNASSSADDVPPPPHVFASSPHSQTFQRKPTSSTLLTKNKREEAPETAVAFKRPRIETPSPLPTFKVRKEKLGDRITALQQLVSPFGKTDTASVLHEAIEYIKYLHDQVSALSAPYLNNGPHVQRYQLKRLINWDQGCDEKESKQDLRSQGLCLAPISSTFSLAKYEMMANELWTHAYGGGALNLMR